MTDNVNITPGVGAAVAADQISSVYYQRVKVCYGDDGSATDVSATNPLPITGTLSLSGTVAATQSGTWTVATNADGTTGSAVPSKGLLVQGSDGTNARNISTTAAGVVKVDLSATAANATKILVTPDANSAVNVAQINGVTVTMGNGVSGTGVQRVTIASDSTGTLAATQSGTWTARCVGNGGASLDAGVGAGTAPTNMVAVGGLYNSTEISPTTGQSAALQLDSKGRLRQVLMDAAGNTRGANVNASNQLSVSVDNSNVSTNIAQMNGVAVTMGNGVSGTGVQRVTIASDSTGTVASTQSGTWTVQPGNTANTTAWLVTPTPGTTGGWSVNSQTGLTNTKVAVKASAGTFGGYMIYNPNSSVAYVQVFDVASASVTLGTTTPTYVIPVPATSGANLEFSNGINHATAITLAATTTATGSTAPTTALTAFFIYK